VEPSVSSLVSERLSSLLFLVALAHGILILGISFTSDGVDDSNQLPSLKVTLVMDTADIARRNEDAEYLAQRDQAGGGDIDAADRPTSTLASADPTVMMGDLSGGDLQDALPTDSAPDAQLLMTRSTSAEQIAADPKPNEQSSQVPEHKMAMIDNPAPDSLAAELDDVARNPQSDERELIISPDTRQSVLALYLNDWRARVEKIGTANFPAELIMADLVHPTLEVAIGADGALKDITVVKSSGSSQLDRAALTILRKAAPFPPLPESVRAEYDVLRFAYDWQFFETNRVGSDLPAGSVQ
jgi:protein TonB